MAEPDAPRLTYPEAMVLARLSRKRGTTAGAMARYWGVQDTAEVVRVLRSLRERRLAILRTGWREGGLQPVWWLTVAGETAFREWRAQQLAPTP